MKLRHDLPILEHPDVYPPSEDSYLMIKAISTSLGKKVLEIGPGSGIVSIHCALEGCMVKAIDINPESVRLTKLNAERCGVSEKITVLEGDLFSPIGSEMFDIIVFNPPYLESKQQSQSTDSTGIDRAWDGGDKGREVIERFLNDAKEHLRASGRIYLILEERNRGEELRAAYPVYIWKEVARADFFFEHIVVYLLRLH